MVTGLAPAGAMVGRLKLALGGLVAAAEIVARLRRDGASRLSAKQF
jgi:hypothetical protein